VAGSQCRTGPARATASCTSVRETWWCCCTRRRRTPGRFLRPTSNWPGSGWRTSGAGWMPSAGRRHGPRARTGPPATRPLSQPSGQGCGPGGQEPGAAQPGVPGGARGVRGDPGVAREELDRRPHPRAALRAGPDPAGGCPASRDLALLHFQAGERRAHPDDPRCSAASLRCSTSNC